MRRTISFLVAVVILAGSGALAYFLVSMAPEPERRKPPPQIPFAQTARVVAGDRAIPVHGAGTVRPSAEIDITPQVSGRVTWINPGFQSGGRVAAGQTILHIEDADYLYRLREAEADLEAQRVALLTAREQAAVARAEYEQYAGRRLGAGSPVYETGPLTLREPQLKAAQAALNRGKAKVAEAELALYRTQVRAPFDGYVREESVDVGQFVNAGQPVGRLFAADAVEVIVPLADTNATLIPALWELRAGDAKRRVDARVIARYGDGIYAWDGYVDRAEVSLDERTRTIDVIVRVLDPFSSGAPLDGTAGTSGIPPLLVGKFVEVRIQGIAPATYFRMPRSALQPGDEVWTVDEDRRVGIVPVRVLQRIDDEAFVTGALQDGQLVVTGGIQFVTEGMVVRTGVDTEG